MTSRLVDRNYEARSASARSTGAAPGGSRSRRQGGRHRHVHLREEARAFRQKGWGRRILIAGRDGLQLTVRSQHHLARLARLEPACTAAPPALAHSLAGKWKRLLRPNDATASPGWTRATSAACSTCGCRCAAPWSSRRRRRRAQQRTRPAPADRPSAARATRVRDQQRQRGVVVAGVVKRLSGMDDAQADAAAERTIRCAASAGGSRAHRGMSGERAKRRVVGAPSVDQNAPGNASITDASPP